jgi:hypothetical protein
MPGDLEAPPILPKRAYGVKRKSRENPYTTTIFARQALGRPATRSAKT